MANLQNKVVSQITLYVDDSAHNSPAFIYAKQYDSNSRYITATIMSKSGKIIPTGEVRLNAKKPNGAELSISGTVNADNTATFKLSQQLLSIAGNVYCDISLTTEDGMLTTSTFFIIVDESHYRPDVIPDEDTPSAGNDGVANGLHYGVYDNCYVIGGESMSGTKGFYIESMTSTSITLKTVNHITGEFALTSDYSVGDKFSIINATHYGFCGTITSVSNNVITYTPITTHGTNTSRPNAPWWEYDTTSTKPDFENHIFWVPSKPECGYSLESDTGELVFGAAFATGDGCFSSADDTFVAGENNVAGGNHCTIFGVENKGSYGNFIACRENFSSGLHSVLLGRWLTNHGDYNFLANAKNTIASGAYNAIFGNEITLDDGNCNLGGGYMIKASGKCQLFNGREHTIGGNYNLVIGSTNSVWGEKNIVGGISNETNSAAHNNIIGGYDNTVYGSCNIVCGYSNKITQGCSWNAVSGHSNTVGGSYNVISGNGIVVNGGYNNIAGYYVQQNGTGDCSLGCGKSINFNGECQVFGGKDHTIIGKLNATFGENNDTNGTHNISAGSNNVIGISGQSAQYCNVSGSENVVKGNFNIISGQGSNIQGSGNAVFGCLHDKKHGGHYLSNTYNALVSGEANKLTGASFSVVLGFHNTLGRSHVYMIGRELVASQDAKQYQFITGHKNVADNGAAMIIGNNGKNCFTVGASGTRSNYSTDAVTVSYLTAQLEERLINGAW